MGKLLRLLYSRSQFCCLLLSYDTRTKRSIWWRNGAVEFVEDGMAVGLGTGTTSRMFIEELGAKVKAEGLKIRCVASSDASQKLAESLGMEVTSLAELPVLDVYIDGADEVAPGLALIKGGGGALLREKIVASSAKRFIVVADSTKEVEHLGKFPLPVEVIRWRCRCRAQADGAGAEPGAAQASGWVGLSDRREQLHSRLPCGVDRGAGGARGGDSRHRRRGGAWDISWAWLRWR